MAISPHIAAFLISFVITFPIGFFFSKFVVFSESNLKGRIQLVRYFSLVLACLLLNYIFIKFFVEYIGLYPTPAKMLTTVFVVTFSYLSQKHYSFSVKKIVSQTEID
jgi:putative flippase GtrA